MTIFRDNNRTALSSCGKRAIAVIFAATMAFTICACGKETSDADSGLTFEAVETTDANAGAGQNSGAEQNVAGQNATDAAILAAPVVKDGVLRPGEDCVETYFEWEPIDGAEGYEVTVQNKYYEEETYREPAETFEITDPNYAAGAQDYFDFKIKVRAYKGSGDARIYSDYSNEAVGSTYDEAEIQNV